MLAALAGDLCQILAWTALLVKPFREWLLGTKALREGQRCLLRSEIVGIYYKRHDARQLRQYEYQNLTQCYGAYKALGGNSFIDHIYGEMQEWDIV